MITVLFILILSSMSGVPVTYQLFSSCMCMRCVEVQPHCIMFIRYQLIQATAWHCPSSISVLLSSILHNLTGLGQAAWDNLKGEISIKYGQLTGQPQPPLIYIAIIGGAIHKPIHIYTLISL